MSWKLCVDTFLGGLKKQTNKKNNIIATRPKLWKSKDEQIQFQCCFGGLLLSALSYQEFPLFFSV